MPEKEELTYREATDEIDRILKAIEDEREVDIDELAGKVERASDLIRVCFERLKGAELKIRKVTDELSRTSLDDSRPQDE